MSTATIATTCAPRSTRRTKQQIEDIRTALFDLLKADNPMTVRQLFYRAVAKGIIDKTEQEYKGTVIRLLTQMRRDRVLPFAWLSDNRRWVRQPRLFDGLAGALQQTAAAYRRDLWANQPDYVEVWVEKDAIAGVVYEVTHEWGVPLMASTGFSSVSYTYTAARNIAEQGKPAYVYYFGDRDPSGVHIDRKIEADLREFAPEADIHFRRMAVTVEQIAELGLPTRPTKKSDSRAKTFAGASVDIDAIPPRTLQEMVENCIRQHIDHRALNLMRVVEQSEREALGALVDRFEQENGMEAAE